VFILRFWQICRATRPVSWCTILLLLWGSGLALVVHPTVSAQELVIESWRKDDQIFWDRVIIPAFQQKHPGIRLKFVPEEALHYDGRLYSRLSARTAGDVIFADRLMEACD